MKNLNYFPFERNKYFYGKLLSVDDFETEQKYMNNKRRLGNRLLNGCGVVSGMNVVQVDDRSFSLEAGVALDFAGREIVVAQPVIKRLPELEGFDSYTTEDEERNSLYLCIEYEEQEKEPVYNMAGDARTSAQGGEFNKVAEGYHLFLTNEPPAPGLTGEDSYYQEHIRIYRGNGIRIYQVFPRYVESGSEFIWKLVVENSGKSSLSFSYRLFFDCLEYEGQDYMDVSFYEEQYEKTGYYEQSFRVRALSVKNVAAGAKVSDRNASMSLDGLPVYQARLSGKNTVYISGNGIEEEIINRYYREIMDKLTRETGRINLYLAELSVIRAGTTYVIDQVRSLPFGQRVYNSVLASLMDRVALDKIAGLEQKLKAWEGRQPAEDHGNGGAEDRALFRIAAGTTVINMGIGGTAGQKYFSEEITHGLGLGAVTIVLGEAYSLKADSRILYGAAGVFADKESVPCSLAARVDGASGTFVIGLKLSETTVTRQVKVHWTAIKDNSHAVYERRERGLYLKPEIAYLKLRETFYFEPVFTGVTDLGVEFKVKEAEGGTIDKNGMYTAPNLPGVYEVLVWSTAYPELKASAFVVVRDV